MKDLRELALKRQSCRDFTDKSVLQEDLLKCLETALLAPSGCNSQPWRFTVVTAKEKKAKLAELMTIVGGNAFAEKAPVLIAVSEVEEPRLIPTVAEKFGAKAFAHGDIGAATVMLTLQATELGLSTCIMGTFDEDEVKKLLDIPQSETVRVVVALGYAADAKVRDKNRAPISELVRFVI